MPVAAENNCDILSIPAPRRVIIGSSHRIYAAGIEHIVQSLPGYEIVGTFSSFKQLISKVAESKPDLVLLGEALIESSPENLGWVFSAHPDARIIVGVENPTIGLCLGVLQQGALGVVPRHTTPEILIECITAVGAGLHWIDHQVQEWVILGVCRE